jgi:hypothetical protein
MPPARQDAALTEEERQRLRQDLVDMRERAAKAAGADPDGAPPAATARKK